MQNPSALPLPAYGRVLASKRLAGLSPDNGRLWVCDDWSVADRCRPFGWVAVVPPDAAPRDLAYPFAAGLDVVVVSADEGRVLDLVLALRPYRPRRLTSLTGAGAAEHDAAG